MRPLCGRHLRKGGALPIAQRLRGKFDVELVEGDHRRGAGLGSLVIDVNGALAAWTEKRLDRPRDELSVHEQPRIHVWKRHGVAAVRTFRGAADAGHADELDVAGFAVHALPHCNLRAIAASVRNVEQIAEFSGPGAVSARFVLRTGQNRLPSDEAPMSRTAASTRPLARSRARFSKVLRLLT